MNRWMYGMAAFAASLMLSSVSHAAFVGIGRPAPGELNHKQIFDQAYGGGFRYAGVNFTNGTITATRVSDDQDSTFAAGTYTTRAIANYGGGSAHFGAVQNGQFQRLNGLAGHRMATGAAALETAPVTFDAPVSFAQQGARGMGGYFSTNDAANADGYDHVVTYKLTGLDFGGEVYVLFFENRLRGRSDFDYNDLVVQISQVAHAPSPAAAAMGVSLLAALAMRRRRSAA